MPFFRDKEIDICALFAEAFGTFWLVIGGCGAAVFAAKHIGFHEVALAFGLSVLTMAFVIGHTWVFTSRKFATHFFLCK